MNNLEKAKFIADQCKPCSKDFYSGIYQGVLIGLDALLSDENKNGVQLIAEERRRQIEKEGWTEQHDDQHNTGDLATAAACYASAEFYRQSNLLGKNNTPEIWPFHKHWWKPTPENRIRELQKAGALIAAEIDRLKRI